MVAIRPFCALRYNPNVVSDLSSVLAPPYDVINPPEQERLYQVSPHNIVRLVLGKRHPSDTCGDNCYTRARRYFEAWTSQHVLERDALPAMYVTAHTFQGEKGELTRLGFMALLQLNEEVDGCVFRHERTLEAPKADRTKLLEAVPANLSPIFCVYPDLKGSAQKIIERVVSQGAPSALARFEGGGIRMWTVSAKDTLESISDHIRKSGVLIADGHHRFEVALANRERYDAIMGYFVSMADCGLRVRSIHRLVRKGAGVSSEALSSCCALEPDSDFASTMRWVSGQKGRGRFGYFDGRCFYRAALHGKRLKDWLRETSVPRPIAELDVVLLHSLIFPAVGLEDSSLSYMSDAAGAVEAVRGGKASAVWLMRAIPLAHVYELASQGMMLPPKSTFFYPKVPTGLTINPIAM